MRSLSEIAFRLRQEVMNLMLLARPPRLSDDSGPDHIECFPDVAQTSASEVVRLAESIRDHRIPLFDREFDFSARIQWRRDVVSGRETSAKFFRRIPYLDPGQAGDHKFVWELNRHQHLVILAEAGDESSWKELCAELESWWEQNPFQRGINWASALEVAFRALSWIQIFRISGQRMTPQFRRNFLESLYQHGHHLETNLSVYFSPNTHLLGEAIALHALGKLFPSFPEAARWAETGHHWVANEYVRQVHPDGSHFEQSSYYHAYALDMFLFHAYLAGASVDQRSILERMTNFLEALLGPNRELPFLGDDDGGRLFCPYGPRTLFARETLRAARSFLGPNQVNRGSRLFANAGLAVMESGDRHILVDVGPFGPGSAGHSHSDTLSVVVRSGSEWLLIDPGTYTYVGDSAWRAAFRGTAAHNTVRIDRRDQARPAGPFRWNDPPTVRVLEWNTSDSRDSLSAECAYGDFVHRRSVVFEKPGRIVIADDIFGPPGEHLVEQFWHLGSSAAAQHLQAQDGVLRESWRSNCFGSKHLGPMIAVEKRTAFPCRLLATLQF